MNSAEILTANTQLWRRVQSDELPPRFWLMGVLVPLLFRSLVYVLLGRMIGGADWLTWTYVGVVFLAVTGSTISHTSDIPIYDVWMRTYPAVSRAYAPVVLQYLSRSVVLMGRALVEAIVVGVAIGLVTTNTSLMLPVLERAWILLPAIVSCTVFGLAIIAPRHRQRLSGPHPQHRRNPARPHLRRTPHPRPGPMAAHPRPRAAPDSRHRRHARQPRRAQPVARNRPRTPRRGWLALGRDPGLLARRPSHQDNRTRCHAGIDLRPAQVLPAGPGLSGTLCKWCSA